MKKRLVALVLCVAMLLGCTVVRAEEEYPSYETTLFSVLDFDFVVEKCRNSDKGVARALIALFLWDDYHQKVENAYELDFTQPIYVSAYSNSIATALVVNFFSKDGHHVYFFSDGKEVGYTVNTDTPSGVKSTLSLLCDWTYEVSTSDLLTALDMINQN